MAPVNSNTFESGQAAGTAITTGNSGGGAGRAWSSVVGTCTYDTARAHGGARAAKIDMAAGTTSQLRWLDGADQAGTTGYARCYVYLTALPSQNLSVLYFTDHLNAFLLRLRIRATGTVDLIDGANQVMATTTAAVATGQWVRLEAKVVCNATTGSGELRLYNAADSATATETLTSTAAWNTGSTKPGGSRFGGLTSTAASDVFWIDDVASDPTNWIGPSQVRVLGQPTETDTANPLSKTKTRTAGQPTEVDTAAAIGRSKVRTLGQGAETDTAASITRTKTRTLGQAVEADTATSAGHTRARAVAQASETDTAAPITPARARALAQATETDTATSVSHTRARSIAEAAETDTAALLGRAKARSAGQPAETNTAAAISGWKTRILGQAAETSTAQPIVRPADRILGQAVETDAALPIAPGKRLHLGQPAETTQALNITGIKARSVTQAAETDIALPIGVPTPTITPGTIRPRAATGAHMSDQTTAAPALRARAATTATIRSGS
ncbi:hypothetical protein [Actinomadura sp. DC4]|uniref:hypothetical protein n=1 Tax=Actinomadura sp. DC4 TaxID=3055069 RepID=UPI0025B003D1|nr:hypothetical protein [Actinomadura sp. DC4]MDN3356079.1 hypothetical protein [Actinomadura sp. DC4]